MESRVVLSASATPAPDAIEGIVEAEPVDLLNNPPEITRLAIAPEEVREGGFVVLRGQFTDPDRGDLHKVAIRWGDGTGQVLSLEEGQRRFVARHRYADDDPTGTPRDEFKVNVTVSDNHGGSDSDSVAGVVYNVAPEITAFRLTPRQWENGVVRLWGKFDDPGRPDVHTVFIDWGDGTEERTELEPGKRAFSARHVYQDDDPSGTPADRYQVRVVLADDDLGRDHVEGQTLIRNVRPEITSLAVRPLDVSPDTELAAVETRPVDVAPDISPVPVVPTIDENGVIVLKGTFRDRGPLDTHTVVVHWGDGTADRWQLDEGQYEFARRHQYLDDPRGPSSNAARDLYRIRVMVIDDDRGRDVESTHVIVHNVAPEITGLAVRPIDVSPTDELAPVTDSPHVEPIIPVIDENGVVLLKGKFRDPGSLDRHFVTIHWGDGSVDRWRLEDGQREFARRHQYLDDPGPNSTDNTRDLYRIRVMVMDDDRGRDIESTPVIVHNVAPEITGLAVRPIDVSPTDEAAIAADAPDVEPVIPVVDENGFVALRGKFEDPGTQDAHTVIVDWGDGNEDRWNLRIGGREIFKTHQYLDDDPSETPRDRYEITVTVADDDGGRDTESVWLVVANVAPEITELRTMMADPGSVDPLTHVGIVGAFVDVGTLDTHRAFVEWGDGTSSAAQVIEEGGSGRFLGRHVYDRPGIYEIVVTLRDDDGGTAREATRVVVPPLEPVDIEPQAAEAALAEWSLFE